MDIIQDSTPTSKALAHVSVRSSYLSLAELSKLKGDLKIVDAYVSIVELWYSILDAIRDLDPIREVIIIQNGVYDIHSLRKKVAAKGERKFARSFMNVLTNFSSFLSLLETSLKRDFSDAPELADQWKLVKSEAYDSFASYRVFYGLRNYSQHVGMIPLRWANNSTNPNTNEIKMYVDKTEILENGSGLTRKVKDDLESMPRFIDFSSLLDEFTGCLQTVIRGYLSVVDQRVRRSALSIVSYRREFSKSGYLHVTTTAETAVGFDTLGDVVLHINDTNADLVGSGFPYDENGGLLAVDA